MWVVGVSVVRGVDWMWKNVLVYVLGYYNVLLGFVYSLRGCKSDLACGSLIYIYISIGKIVKEIL